MRSQLKGESVCIHQDTMAEPGETTEHRREGETESCDRREGETGALTRGEEDRAC